MSEGDQIPGTVVDGPLGVAKATSLSVAKTSRADDRRFRVFTCAVSVPYAHQGATGASARRPLGAKGARP
jgi:hypothetical protein